MKTRWAAVQKGRLLLQAFPLPLFLLSRFPQPLIHLLQVQRLRYHDVHWSRSLLASGLDKYPWTCKECYHSTVLTGASPLHSPHRQWFTLAARLDQTLELFQVRTTTASSKLYVGNSVAPFIMMGPRNGASMATRLTDGEVVLMTETR